MPESEITEPPSNFGSAMQLARDLYERTSLTAEQISERTELPHKTIIKLSVDQGWQRQHGVMASTLLAAREVESRKEREQKLVEIQRVNLRMQADVLHQHREDLKRLRKQSLELFALLSAPQDEEDSEENLTLDKKSNIFKRLVDSHRQLILLERQNFGILGAIMEPDQPKESGEDELMTGLDVVLHKFRDVLSKGAQKPHEIKNMGPAVVIENEGTNGED